jgi:hypothetical protein
VQVSVKPGDDKTVILTPDQALQETKRYRLTVSAVADRVGNVITEHTSKEFSGPGMTINQLDVLGVASVQTAPDGRTITVTFTDEVDATSARNKASYALTENIPVTEVLLDERGYKNVQVKTGAKLGPQRYTLTITNVALRSDPSRVQRKIDQGVNGPGVAR